MKLKNVLIVVSDMEKSKAFYHDLMGMSVVTDFGDNVILTEGLVLQEKSVWEETLGKKTTAFSNHAELYFEEYDMEAFADKLEKSSYEIEYVTCLSERKGGRKVLRFYDPDGHMIEVAEV